jgi:hypothetical protein
LILSSELFILTGFRSGLGGQSQASSRRPQAIKINETWANNEGLFVKAKLQNKCLAFLIDTGISS